MTTITTTPTGPGLTGSEALQKAGETNRDDNSLANEMKNIRKRHLQRKVFSDPSLAAKLVVAEASPVYNAQGEIIPAVSRDLGAA